MADLTQNVKYVVDVDLSALDKLRLAMEQVIATAKGLDASFSRTQRATKAAMDGATASTNKSKDAIEGHAAATVAGGRREIDTVEKVQRVRFEAHVDHMNRMEKEKAAHLKKIAAENRAFNAGMRNLKAYTDYANRATKEVSDGMQMRFLKVFGTFQALRYTAQQVFTAIKDGAASLDLDRVLGTQLQNFTGLMEDARKATAGMVGDAGLKKSIALMTSFGIPTQGMADSLGLVQKMAIRTGQSAEFLTESFARGISRLSPLILDNLGIQVSLNDANEAYAKSVGKSTDQLTKAEQTTALLNETLRLLRKNTEGIDLGSSVGGAVARAEALWDNVKTSAKEAGASIFVGLDMFFGDLEKKAAYAVSIIREMASKTKDASGNLTNVGKGINEAANALMLLSKDKGLLEPFVWDKAIASVEDFQNEMTGLLSHTLENRKTVYREYLDAVRGMSFADVALTQEEALADLPTLIPKLLLENVIDAKREAINLVEAFKATAAARGAVVTKAEEERLLVELTGKAQDHIVKTLGWMQRLMGGNNELLATSLLSLLESGDAYRGITRELFKQVDAWVANTKIQREAMAVMDARLRQHEADIEFNTRKQGLLDGQLRSEIELGATKAALAAADEQHAKALEEVRSAMNDADRRAALDRADAARVARDLAMVSYSAATAFNKQQQEYIDSFKGKNASIVKQEVDKLRTQAEQLRTQAAMLEVMLRIQAAGKDINTEQVRALQLQADGAEALAERIGKSTSTGGGGRGPRSETDRSLSPFGQWLIEQARIANERKRFHEGVNQQLADLQDIGKRASALIPSTHGHNKIGLFDLLNPEKTFLGVDEGDFQAKRDAIKEVLALQEEYLKAGGNKEGFAAMAGISEADLQRTDEYLVRYGEHVQRMKAAADELAGTAQVMRSFGDGMDGLFGDEWITRINNMTSALENLGDALAEPKNNLHDLTLAGIPAMRAFTSFFIKDLKTRAWFEMAMQAAAAWAAFATPGGQAKGVMHATAATMYGLVAGGVLRLPKGKSKEDKAGASDRAMPLRRDVHIHIAGPIATTEAERGAMIRDAIRAAEREGI